MDEPESGEHFVRWILLPAAIVVALPAAVGAVQPNPAAKPVQPPYPKVMSRSELRACMLRERDLDARNQAFDAERTTHDEALARAAEEAKTLAKELSAVPPSDESAVGRYNAKVAQRNKVVDALNKQADAMNAILAQIHADTADYMNECASKVFNRADEQALIKELGPRTKPRIAHPPEPVPAKYRPIEV